MLVRRTQSYGLPPLKPLILMLVIFSLGVCTVDGGDCGGNGSLNFVDTVVVDKSGSGNFTSVQSAIDSIPLNNRRWIKVQINPGVFVEKVTIPRGKPCIVLEGRDRSVTVITFNGHDQTDKSATFTSVADNIVAKGITFKNSYNHPWLQKRVMSNRQIPGVARAVAARILGDKSAIFRVRFLGAARYAVGRSRPPLFLRCHIKGTEDFISECSINITACAFSSQLSYGGKIFDTTRTYLGRTWGPYSRVIFQRTTMTSDMIPQGWDAWKFPGKEENFVYAEVDCKGPGSYTSKRVPGEKSG
ncbi:hypothetical protein GQ457_08G009330 [Hibiscus cannabinus]